MFRKDKTMRPKKKIPKGSLRYTMHKTIKAGVSKGDLLESVKCPSSENINEWLAVNCFDFFNEILLSYSAICDLCTVSTCPVMNAGPKMEYLWSDPVQKKNIAIPAKEYCERLFEWVQTCFDNSAIFPEQFDSKPPKEFKPTLTKIFKRLFRVYAHMFYSHQKHMENLQINDSVTVSFRHFYVFCNTNKLLNKDDIEPLKDMTKEIDKEFGLAPL